MTSPGERLDPPHRTGRDAVLVAVPYATWGSVGLFVRWVDLPAIAIAGWRLLMAVVGISLIRALRPAWRVRAAPGQRRILVVLGVALGLSWPLFFLGLQLIDIGVATVLSFSWPLWYVALAFAVRRERQPWTVVAALAVCLVGLALLALRSGSLPRGDDALGILAALGASVLAAVQLLVIRSVALDVPALTVNLWQTSIGALMLAPFTVHSALSGEVTVRAVAILLLIGGVFTGVGAALQVAGARRLDPAHTSAISYLEPLVATALGVLVLGERVRPLGAVGGALVLGGGMFVLLRGRRDDRSSELAVAADGERREDHRHPG